MVGGCPHPARHRPPGARQCAQATEAPSRSPNTDTLRPAATVHARTPGTPVGARQHAVPRPRVKRHGGGCHHTYTHIHARIVRAKPPCARARVAAGVLQSPPSSPSKTPGSRARGRAGQCARPAPTRKHSSQPLCQHQALRGRWSTQFQPRRPDTDRHQVPRGSSAAGVSRELGARLPSPARRPQWLPSLRAPGCAWACPSGCGAR